MDLFKNVGMADNIDDYTHDLLNSTGFTLIDIMYELENEPEVNAALLEVVESAQDGIHDGLWNDSLMRNILNTYITQSIGES